MSVRVDNEPHRAVIEYSPYRKRWRVVIQRHFVGWRDVRFFRWRRSLELAERQQAKWVLRHTTELVER